MKKYDVVVVGGGIGGIAAAVAAARNRASACIIEKHCMPGGLATLGNVVIYLPLCDGLGHQVTRGLGEELLKLSVKDGSGSIPECWKGEGDTASRIKNRYRARFNPASFMLALEEFLLLNKVDIFYDTRFTGVKKEGRRIDAVAVENKDGRSFLKCAAVVDASGDADVCEASGEKTFETDTNAAAGWFFYFDGRDMKMNALSDFYDPLAGKGPEGKPSFSGSTADGVNAHLLYSHKLIRERISKLKRENPSVYPFLLPSIPCFRMTRRLKGEIEIREENKNRVFPDTVGITGDWRKAGPVYHIPFRALRGTVNSNLVTAGRCISSGSAWDITRAIPACAVSGEAAGTAAAMLSAGEARSFSSLDAGALQERLKKQGVMLSFP